ncbi:hypothetical protein [Kitasatospora sp. NPDC090091]|uniref:hypothetical protein n=1 Tax=Kitasatospora sp. NPDC090091 TaxID=3364081 RepID=UPI0038074ABF
MPNLTQAWFDLARHDETDQGDPAAGADPGTPDPADDDQHDPATGADPADDPAGETKPASDDEAKLGDAGKRAIDRMKADTAAAKRAAAEERKARLAAEARVREFEDRDKSELEKATAKAERAADQAAKAVARAVSAEIRASATDRFADPSDAIEVLMRDPAQYVDADGDIDTDAIQAALADLLDRKPHWARPEPAPAAPAEPAAERPRRPRPDPGQGSRPPAPPTDFRSASREERDAELAKYGYRLRS